MATKKEKVQEVAEVLDEMPRLKEKYLNETVPALKEKFQYENVMQIPKLEKIIINMGLGARRITRRGSKRQPRSSDRSPARKPSSARRRSPSRTSKFVRA